MELILLEGGADLLLENGGYFLLEGSAPLPPGPEALGDSGMLDDLYGPDWLNACAYGARGDGFTDSTNAIQAALNAGQNVYLPVGNYRISQPLTLTTGQSLWGAGMGLTIITQVNTAAHALTMTDQRYITVEDIMLQGPGSGTGAGIYFNYSASPLAGLSLENIRVAGFGSYGVYLNTPITSALKNIRVQSCGNDYFYLTNGTSCVLEACYANTTTVGSVSGYQLHAMSYSTLNGCAADFIVGSTSGGGAGYLINGGFGISLNSCGCESSAIGFKMTTSAQTVHLNACETFETTYASLVVASTSTNITATSFMERTPNGATYSVQTTTGTSTVLISPALTTAASYATGTAYVLTATGGTAH